MAVVSAQTLTIDGIPNVGVLILGAGEEKVTFPVVTDLSNGLFVSMQTYRFHFGRIFRFCLISENLFCFQLEL